MKSNEVIASEKDFHKMFKKAPKTGERMEALSTYFRIGGVIKAHEEGKEWPKLAYPSSDVINSKLKELHEKKKLYTEKVNNWKRQHLAASMYHEVNQLKKLKEPLYWKHVSKMATDPEYRKEAESVKLPAHLVGDKKWKPMINMFVNDADYRKQLSETVTTSIAYKKNRKVAQYADDVKDFRMETSQKQIVVLEKKLAEFATIESALHEMQKWSKE